VRTPRLATFQRLPPALALAAAVVVLLTAVVPVLAHADLVASDPADKAVLTDPPTKITLTFSEGLDKGKSSFKVIGSSGTVGTGKPPKDGATTMSLDGLELGTGPWTIRWTSAAQDGHIARGTLTFFVAVVAPEPGTPAPSAAEPTATPGALQPSASALAPATHAAAATPAAEATPAPSANPAAPATASEGNLILPIVVGLALVAVVGVLILRRSRLG
jgi:methionine-rich copper-binding protein CopC